VLVGVDRHQKFELWCRLLLSAGTKNQVSKIKKTLEPRYRPVGPRSKPVVIGQRHRCLGGACAHAVTALEESAPALPVAASAT
jgi:hypothetical protein